VGLRRGTLEGMVTLSVAEPAAINPEFWNGKRVAITGHTGFKGGWLSLWMHGMGVKLYGFSKPPNTQPSLFEQANIPSVFSLHRLGDIADEAAVNTFMKDAQPELVFHLAAQPLVRQSYQDPLETYRTNVMGTANLLQAVRNSSSVKVVVVVTSDKCYENQEWAWGYRETDPMGGYDPYSSSKGCQELVAASFRKSFFKDVPRLATARAGNVIGGGDWSADRLVPDAMRAYAAGQILAIRYPGATRPWQHVLEPLAGYLTLAQQLAVNSDLAPSFNFGPREADTQTVGAVLQKISACLPTPLQWQVEPITQPHEASMLKLDYSLSNQQLGWQPHWGLSKAIYATCHWYSRVLEGESARDLCALQIHEFQTCYNNNAFVTA
jgi:CDP-glucose 4,6-dehydratase